LGIHLECPEPQPETGCTVRHAIIPILLYLPLSQALRDNFYPVSHFPMYSQPTDKPLKIHMLTDGKGNLLPVMTRSGVTPSHMSKMYGGYHKDLIQKDAKAANKEGRAPVSEESLMPAAAKKVLEVLRKQSLTRKAAEHLTEELQLRESQVGFGDAGFVEEVQVLATLPAMTEVKP
jgi:hypothetical protein